MRVKLKDLQISLIQPDGTFVYFPLKESPYYKSLLKLDHGIFDKYRDQLALWFYKKPITSKEEITYAEFLKLHNDIRDNGFKIMEPKIRIEDNVRVLDGQHRLSILLYLYGEYFEVEIEHNRVVGVLMGNTKNIIKKQIVPVPQQNNRITVELCENIHLHYRNLRLEFTKEEFLPIVKLVKSLDEKKIEEFEYGPDKFKALIYQNTLPDNTEFNDRLQIEEQEEGHFHVHYRNLRIEVNDLGELGIKKEEK